MTLPEEQGFITESGVYADEQISAHISVTPEGYLLCENVRMARIGDYEYEARDIPMAEPDGNGKVIAIRKPEDVFKPEAIASFEGKPVTVEHPPELLNSSTWKRYSVGVIQNPRASGDYLEADLLVTDEQAIKQIQERGLKNLSCGYTSKLELLGKGKVKQTEIKGNHVALVEHPRAGKECAIIDAKSINSSNTAKGTTMSNQSIAKKLKALFKLEDGIKELKDDYVQSVLENEDEDTSEEVVDESTELQKDIDLDTKVIALLKEVLGKAKVEDGKISFGDDEEVKAEEVKEEVKDEEEVEDEACTDDEEAEGEYPLGDSFQTIIGKAEILSPGFQAKSTLTDAINSTGKYSAARQVKLQVITEAASQTANKALFDSVLGTKPLNSVEGSAIDILFNSLVELKRIANRSKQPLVLIDGLASKSATGRLAEIAAMHQQANIHKQ